MFDAYEEMVSINMDSPNRVRLDYLTGLKQKQPKPVFMFDRKDDAELIQATIKSGVNANAVDGLNPQRVKSVRDFCSGFI